MRDQRESSEGSVTARASWTVVQATSLGRTRPSVVMSMTAVALGGPDQREVSDDGLFKDEVPIIESEHLFGRRRDRAVGLVALRKPAEGDKCAHVGRRVERGDTSATHALSLGERCPGE